MAHLDPRVVKTDVLGVMASGDARLQLRALVEAEPLVSRANAHVEPSRGQKLFFLYQQVTFDEILVGLQESCGFSVGLRPGGRLESGWSLRAGGNQVEDGPPQDPDSRICADHAGGFGQPIPRRQAVVIGERQPGSLRLGNSKISGGGHVGLCEEPISQVGYPGLEPCHAVARQVGASVVDYYNFETRTGKLLAGETANRISQAFLPVSGRYHDRKKKPCAKAQADFSFPMLFVFPGASRFRDEIRLVSPPGWMCGAKEALA